MTQPSQTHFVYLGATLCKRKNAKKTTTVIAEFLALSPGEQCRSCAHKLSCETPKAEPKSAGR